MDDKMKTPTPQWLLDALHIKPVRPIERGPYPQPMPPISADAIRAMMEDIVSVCATHGLWLSHEDDFGAFLVQRKSTREWLLEARGYE